MKLYDRIEIITDAYEKQGIKRGTLGAIVFPEIRDDTFGVELFNLPKGVYELQSIKIQDLKVIEESKITDEAILEELPLNNPAWWCKVEDGYIINLLGEKKNKIPYDYNS